MENRRILICDFFFVFVNLWLSFVIKGKETILLTIKKITVMKKVFGIILVIVGLVCLPQAFTPSVPETIGGLIGVSLVTFLPAYFLLRNNKK